MQKPLMSVEYDIAAMETTRFSLVIKGHHIAIYIYIYGNLYTARFYSVKGKAAIHSTLLLFP